MVEGSWSMTQGSRFRVQDSRLGVHGSAFTIQGTRFRVHESWLRVQPRDVLPHKIHKVERSTRWSSRGSLSHNFEVYVTKIAPHEALKSIS